MPLSSASFNTVMVSCARRVESSLYWANPSWKPIGRFWSESAPATTWVISWRKLWVAISGETCRQTLDSHAHLHLAGVAWAIIPAWSAAAGLAAI